MLSVFLVSVLNFPGPIYKKCLRTYVSCSIAFCDLQTHGMPRNTTVLIFLDVETHFSSKTQDPTFYLRFNQKPSTAGQLFIQRSVNFCLHQPCPDSLGTP